MVEPQQSRHALARPAGTGLGAKWISIYLLLGIYFGIVLMKAEVVSWFRLQEMFRFQSFHMYGIIGSAVLVAAVSLRILKTRERRSLTGESIAVPPKQMGSGVRYALGGTMFGTGWALTGACPGPMLALFGGGVSVIIVAIGSALVGAWSYGALRPKLPH